LRAVAVLALGVAAACPPEIEPAPEDLDGVAHWLWVNYELADDAAALAQVDAGRQVVPLERLDHRLLARIHPQARARVVDARIVIAALLEKGLQESFIVWLKAYKERRAVQE